MKSEAPTVNLRIFIRFLSSNEFTPLGEITWFTPSTEENFHRFTNLGIFLRFPGLEKESCDQRNKIPY